MDLAPLFRRFRAVDWMVLGYVLVVSGVALARLQAQPAIRWVLVAHALVVLLVFLTARPGLGRAGRVLREAYPLLLLGGFYPALEILNSFGGAPTWDATVRRWELALFGLEPARIWWERAPSVAWSTLLHGAYFAYYPIVLAPLVVFLARGQGDHARRAVRWLMSTFLLCYLVFLLFPVAGPYYEYPRPAAWFLDNPMARLVYGTLSQGSAYGAAFPSSHVAAALVATAAAFRGWPRLGWILLLPTLLMVVAVVYCQMHYAVDALAGLALAGGMVAAWVAAETRRGET